jgi:hypothetical protein
MAGAAATVGHLATAPPCGRLGLRPPAIAWASMTCTPALRCHRSASTPRLRLQLRGATHSHPRDRRFRALGRSAPLPCVCVPHATRANGHAIRPSACQAPPSPVSSVKGPLRTLVARRGAGQAAERGGRVACRGGQRVAGALRWAPGAHHGQPLMEPVMVRGSSPTCTQKPPVGRKP